MIRITVRRKIVNAANRDFDMWYTKELELPFVPWSTTCLVIGMHCYYVDTVKCFANSGKIELTLNQDNGNFKDKDAFTKGCDQMVADGFTLEEQT